MNLVDCINVKILVVMLQFCKILSLGEIGKIFKNYLLFLGITCEPINTSIKFFNLKNMEKQIGSLPHLVPS